MPPAGGHCRCLHRLGCRAGPILKTSIGVKPRAVQTRCLGVSLRKLDVSGQDSLGSDLGKKTRCSAGVPG